MAMIVHDLIQGSPEWKAHRATRRNASDAAAMLGESPYMKRSELMHAIATGVVPEPSDYQQYIFDNGHRFERYARPLAEAIMGTELYPVSGSLADSLMSASFDGIDEDETEAFEHKSLNAILREAMQGEFTGRDLPIYYRIQMEQQIAVSGVKRVLFMASAWLERKDAEPELIEERHVWYYPDPELRARIVAGWAIFEEELAVYVPPEPKALIVAKAAVVLPVIDIEVSGQLAVRANFDVFKARFTEYLESIPKKPSTDQEFADCDAAIKQLDKIEKKMGEVADGTLEKAAAVNEVVKTAEALREQARKVRLATEKLVKARKEEIKGEIIAEGVKGFADHMKALNERIGEALMPTTGLAPDFAEAIKGKRNFDSSRDAMKVALADAKLEASAIADRIQVNLRLIDGQDAKHAHLFKQDRAVIVLKAADDLIALVKNRTTEFDIAEKARIDAEAERIAAAAKAKAAEIVAAAPAPAPAAEPARIYGGAVAPLFATDGGYVAAEVTVREPGNEPTFAAPIVSASKVRLGALCELLGFTITAEGMTKLGIEPVGKEGVAKLYAVSDFGRIRAALIGRLNAITLDDLEAIAAVEKKRA